MSVAFLTSERPPFVERNGYGGSFLPGFDRRGTAAADPDGLLVGISRAITDYHFCTYLSDLAVDEAYQRRGIGQELIRRTHEAAGRKTQLILLAAPKARSYYPHIGMAVHDSCWTIARESKLGS